MKMPKITIDREYTTLAQVDKVKEDSKEFSNCYTVGDLIREFTEQTEYNEIWAPEILKVEIKAFPAGTNYNNETHFSVDMILDKWDKIYKVHYYCDMNIRIDTRILPGGMKMYSVKKYTAS